MKTLATLAGMASFVALAYFAPDDGSAGKSIVDPKYRAKKDPDWMAGLIAANATKFKTVPGKEVPVEGSDPPKTTKLPDTEKPDGVDVDKLFNLAAINNIDVAKFEAQRGSHGFEGRFRMTVSNMLRAAARNRHGVFMPGVRDPASKSKKDPDPVWTPAPTDWLTNSKPPAPKEPTHNQDGTKIKKAAPVTEEPTKTEG